MATNMIEDAFNEIADETSQRAAGVDCLPSEYRDGLRTIIQRLEADIAANEATNPND